MFMESFKYYKSKNPPPDFQDVLKFDENSADRNFKTIMLRKKSPKLFPGLRNPMEWNIYELTNRPGLVIIKNIFSPNCQRYWMAKCLKDYHRRPNETNIQVELYNKFASNSEDRNWWQIRSKIEDPKEKDKFTKSLRWTTLGYHYNWTDKIYDENLKNDFPKDLDSVTSFIASCMGYDDFKSEAAIVNYYPIGSTLSAHTDHSEKNLEAPLFSLSFGQSAIFLIGGETKDEKPLALLLQSGDVVVMTKKSRLCYHAVPRVFKADNQPWEVYEEDVAIEIEPSASNIDLEIWNLCKSKNQWVDFSEYIKTSRININIRQVLNKNENHL